MRNLEKPVLWLLVGALVGILAGVEAIHLAGDSVCPESVCVDQASVIPISDRGYFPAVHERLRSASQSIHVVAFEFKYYPSYPESSQNLLVEDLIAAHGRGVEVKVVVDEYSSENSAVPYLLENGVDVKLDGEEKTTHAKLIVIDGQVVILGSTNFSFFGLERNNEADVMIVSEQTAAYFEKYFWSLWESGS